MQLQETIQAALLISLVPFSVSLLLDLCFGKPAAEEYDRKAIFFGWSLLLAKRRLKQAGKFKEIEDTYLPNLNSKDLTIKHSAEMEYKKVVFEQGRDFFDWELGVGMCPFCTNVRASILFSLLYLLLFSVEPGSFLIATLVPCFSNMYLLFFNKFKL